MCGLWPATHACCTQLLVYLQNSAVSVEPLNRYSAHQLSGPCCHIIENYCDHGHFRNFSSSHEVSVMHACMHASENRSERFLNTNSLFLQCIKVTGYWCGYWYGVFTRIEFDLLPQKKPSRATARCSTCTTLKTVAVTCIVVAADLLNIQDYSSKISQKKDVSGSNSTAPVEP